MVRFKNRYLLCELEYGVDHAAADKLMKVLSGRDVLVAIKKSLEENFGSLGSAKAYGPALAIKYWSPMLGLAVVRTARDEADKVRAAATLVFEIAGPSAGKVRLSVRHVAGTITSCQKAGALVAKEIIRERMNSSDGHAFDGGRGQEGGEERKRKWERVQQDALRDLAKIEQ